jgi:hypothetical protein
MAIKKKKILFCGRYLVIIRSIMILTVAVQSGCIILKWPIDWVEKNQIIIDAIRVQRPRLRVARRSAPEQRQKNPIFTSHINPSPGRLYIQSAA